MIVCDICNARAEYICDINYASQKIDSMDLCELHFNRIQELIHAEKESVQKPPAAPKKPAKTDEQVVKPSYQDIDEIKRKRPKIIKRPAAKR